MKTPERIARDYIIANSTHLDCVKIWEDDLTALIREVQNETLDDAEKQIPPQYPQIRGWVRALKTGGDK